MACRAPLPLPGGEALWEESPGSPEEAAAILARCARENVPVYPLGAGTAAGRLPLPSARGGILRTERLSGIVEFEAGDLVLTAGAGTRLA
ncbi:MAG: FAD-binding protein, partial [Planctomycetota bacterium]